jgi:hypothetical protein
MRAAGAPYPHDVFASPHAAHAGMAFQSGVTSVGSGPHLALTWLVAIVLVSCICLFFGMLAVELWRSVQFARRVASVVRKASSVSGPRRATVRGPAGTAARWTVANPLMAPPPPVVGAVDPRVRGEDGDGLAPGPLAASRSGAVDAPPDRACVGAGRAAGPPPPPPPPPLLLHPESMPLPTCAPGRMRGGPPPPPPRASGSAALTTARSASPRPGCDPHSGSPPSPGSGTRRGSRHSRITSMLRLLGDSGEPSPSPPCTSPSEPCPGGNQ